MSTARKNSTARKANGRITVHAAVQAAEITTPAIRRAVRAALSGYRIDSISVAIVDDSTIAELHERYMRDPRPTDVLSFDLRDDPAGREIEGEIVLSAEMARKAARSLGLSERQEVLRYAIHGALHLAGWNDRTAGERAKMRREEDRVLGRIGE